jgi:hypothetical protein
MSKYKDRNKENNLEILPRLQCHRHLHPISRTYHPEVPANQVVDEPMNEL